MGSKQVKQPDDVPQGVEWEYKSLRAEVLQRIGMRQQIISLTMTIAGVFLAFGIENSTIALIYPLIAAALALNWIQNERRILGLSKYVRMNIERKWNLGLNWETERQRERMQSKGLRSIRFTLASHGSIFLITQVLATVVGMLQLSLRTTDLGQWILVVVDAFAVGIVLELFRTTHRNASPESKDDGSRWW